MVILSEELQPNDSLCGLLSGWLLFAIAQSMLLSVYALALVRAGHFSLSRPLEVDSPSVCLHWGSLISSLYLHNRPQKNTDTMFESRGIPFILLDIACLILAGLPLAAFNLGKIKPYQRGFFCNDESVGYPFHTSTVSSTVLYTVGFTLPICSVSNPR